MNTSEPLLERIQAYCLAKPGVSAGSSRDGQRLSYNVLGMMPTFVWEIALDESPVRLVIKCYDRVLETLPENAPVKVRVYLEGSKTIPHGGSNWKWVNVWLDGTLSEAEIFRLLDDSYQIILDELDETDIRLIELAGCDLTTREALDALIDSNHLQHRRAEIEGFLDTAILLRTHAAEEENLALGQSKIGGSPDLPEGWAFPLFDGKPVAFLAQVNLAEIPETIRKNPLPSVGVLYLFSMFGWADDEDAYWDTSWWERFNETGFSRVLYYDSEPTSLKRWIPSDSHTPFKAARIEFAQVLSIPRAYDQYTRDPILGKLDWTEEEFRRFDDLYFDFAHLLSGMGLSSEHQLLGYANPVHNAVTQSGTQLLFEMFTGDKNLGKIPGNGGIIYLTIARSKLENRNFSNIQTDFHFD